MKNKTTKTIACVIAGLTLSACVGSVNLPTETESETLQPLAKSQIPHPNLDVIGTATYMGVLNSSLPEFKRINGFIFNVDFSSRQITGGKTVSITGKPAVLPTSGQPSHVLFGGIGDSARMECSRVGGVWTPQRAACLSRRIPPTSGSPATPNINHNLSIEGNFTPDGVIGGKVVYELCNPTCPRFGQNADLSGTIDNQTIDANFQGEFSGGFIAQRQ